MSKTELEEKFGSVQYIVYDNNGTILKTGICQVAMLEQQKESGQKVIKQQNQNAIIRDDTHMIKEGTAVKKKK